MPSTENDRRNQNRVDIQNPSVPSHPRIHQAGMHAARPSSHIAPDPDLIEESELPAAIVSLGAGIETRNSEEGGELNESVPHRGYVLPIETESEEESVDPEVSSIDQDNNLDRE